MRPNGISHERPSARQMRLALPVYDSGDSTTTPNLYHSRRAAA